MPVANGTELIVLTAPISADGYYADVESDIIDFHVEYAKSVAKYDNVLVLTDESHAPLYKRALGDDQVVIMPMADIWMRNFSLSNAAEPIMFRYTAAAQDDQQAANAVQEVFYRFVKQAKLKFHDSDLLHDGGNFVDDYHGNVILSTKFLIDNDLTEAEARKKLTAFASITNVAFIEADEQGGLEHADGVVTFIDRDVLMVNSYPSDPAYMEGLKQDLMRGIPSIEIHEIITPYDDSKIYDERFGSACGLYTNALVTPERIYLPQFGIEQDKLALEQVRSLTQKHVIPVQSNQVCHMGSGVRCMLWQLRGHNADQLIAWLNRYRATDGQDWPLSHPGESDFLSGQ